jgi:hypothetical protein
VVYSDHTRTMPRDRIVKSGLRLLGRVKNRCQTTYDIISVTLGRYVQDRSAPSSADLRLLWQVLRRPWTGYNIRLTRFVSTMPGKPEFLEADGRLQAVLRAVSILQHGSLQGLRVADQGGFALAMARQGATVLGVEARSRNLARARLLKEHFGLANLEFVQADVKDFTAEAFGRWDVVLALGILYHLDDPVRWLGQLGALTGAMLIVDTHVAPPDEASLARIASSLSALGPLERVTVDGVAYEGRWWREVVAGVKQARQPWAAASNEQSFWLTKESLVRALTRAGFDLVFEQHDCLPEQYSIRTVNLLRVMIVALKTSSVPAHP